MSSYNVSDSQRNSSSAAKAARLTPKARKSWARIERERARDQRAYDAGMARIAALTQRED
jgi:hypothetical protein